MLLLSRLQTLNANWPQGEIHKVHPNAKWDQRKKSRKKIYKSIKWWKTAKCKSYYYQSYVPNSLLKCQKESWAFKRKKNIGTSLIKKTTTFFSSLENEILATLRYSHNYKKAFIDSWIIWKPFLVCLAYLQSWQI